MDQTTNIAEDEISLRDIIIKIRDINLELLSKWKLIIVVAVLFGILGFTYSYFKRPTYVALTTFMLESGSNAGNIPSYLNMASQFGIVTGLNVDEDKIVKILSSKRIIHSALMEKAAINNKNDYLGNHYIEIFDKKDKWKNDEELNDFMFKNDYHSIGELGYRVLTILHREIVDNFLIVEKSREGIISVKVETGNEGFSKYFNDYVVKAVSDFYISNVTEKERSTVDMLESEVDSIFDALNVAEARWASWKDKSFGLIKYKGSVEEVRLKRDMEILNVMYVEAVKNLEVAKFNLLNETPFIQIIDSPNLPLSKFKTSVFRSSIISVMLGLGFAGIFIILRKIYLDIIGMNSIQPEIK